MFTCPTLSCNLHGFSQLQFRRPPTHRPLAVWTSIPLVITSSQTTVHKKDSRPILILPVPHHSLRITINAASDSSIIVLQIHVLLCIISMQTVHTSVLRSSQPSPPAPITNTRQSFLMNDNNYNTHTDTLSQTDRHTPTDRQLQSPTLNSHFW